MKTFIFSDISSGEFMKAIHIHADELCAYVVHSLLKKKIFGDICLVVLFKYDCSK